MKRVTRMVLYLILVTAALHPGLAAAHDPVVVTVDASDNAVFGGGYIELPLSPDATTVDVAATGLAYSGLGRPFAGALIQQHLQSGGIATHVLSPGVPVHLTDCGGYILLFFVDDNASDNSGEYQVTFSPSGGPPMDPVLLSASSHCLDASRAVDVSLSSMTWIASATGEARFANGDASHYLDLVVMSDSDASPAQRSFYVIPLDDQNQVAVPVSSGSAWCFFVDASGIVGDNSGYAQLTFDPDSIPTTYCIHADGTGDFPTIQAAINAADNGDIIELADGTFTGDGNRDLDPHGKAIAIRSASGDPQTCIIDCEGSPTDPHRGFRIQSGEGPECRIEGITITHGRAVGPSWDGRAGGGIACENGASPTIVRCILLENWADDTGAGIVCRSGGSPTLVECTFIENHADWCGAALRCADTAEPTVRRCTFYGNWAYLGGSGIHCSGSGSPTIENTIIAFSERGCAVDNEGGPGIPQLVCCDIFGNEGGDWIGCIADQLGIDRNFSADPCFCDPDNDDFTLWNYSPCAQVTCGTIGAWPVACWDPQGIVDSDASPAAQQHVLDVSLSPNPFSGTTRISFASPTTGAVRVGIFDMAGREVRSLVADGADRGSPALTWDGRDHAGLLVPAGVYWVRASQGDRETSSRVMVVR